MLKSPKTRPASAESSRFGTNQGSQLLAVPPEGNPPSAEECREHELKAPPQGTPGSDDYLEWVERRFPPIQAAVLSLEHLTGRRECGFVAELYNAFELWVWDLPASEGYHHAGRFGLLEHSMEVAVETLKDLEQRWCGKGGGVDLTQKERALWSRVAFALALFHDCGKILDVDVRGPKGRERWNPLVESLTRFMLRHDISFVATTPYKFLVGRGPWGHEQKGGQLLPRFMDGPKGERILPHLEIAWTAYVRRGQPGAGPFPIPAAYLADRVKQADGWSTGKGRMRRRPGEEQGAPPKEVQTGSEAP